MDIIDQSFRIRWAGVLLKDFVAPHWGCGGNYYLTKKTPITILELTEYNIPCTQSRIEEKRG